MGYAIVAQEERCAGPRRAGTYNNGCGIDVWPVIFMELVAILSRIILCIRIVQFVGDAEIAAAAVLYVVFYVA